MKTLILPVAVATILVASVVAPTRGAIVVTEADYLGTRTTETGGGLFGAGLWDGVTSPQNGNNGNNGFQIMWEITLDGSTFTYKYTISGVDGTELTRALSHWILELSAGVDWSETDFGFGFDEVRNDLTTPDRWGPGPSNPGMPGELAGVKFDSGGQETGPWVYEFETEQRPVWGSFYAVDGGNPDTYAFNIGFTDLSTMPPVGTTDFTNWIAVPDTEQFNGGPSVVPEPGTLAIWGLLGALGLAWRMRRKAEA